MNVNYVKENYDTQASVRGMLAYMINRQILNTVNTMMVVRVTAVDAGGASSPTGYVDAQPLVTQYDGQNSMVRMPELYKLPYSRIQGGKCALVIDPEVGDLGIAVFAQYDTQNITKDTTEQELPATLMPYPMHCGWYIGGFLNKIPETFIELTQDDGLNITSPNGITIKAENGITIDAPTVTVTGDVIASGISLVTHTHGGCMGGSTGTPS